MSAQCPFARKRPGKFISTRPAKPGPRHHQADDRRIRKHYRSNELCQRLGKIEGVGPLGATAPMAAVGD